MSDCPLWQPQCVAQEAVGGVIDVAQGARKAYDVGSSVISGAGRVIGAANDITSPVGGLLGVIPLLLLVLLGWMLWRMLAGGVRTVRTAGPAVVQGYTGVDIREVRERPAKSGERYGRELRARRESHRGPQLGVHTGTAPQLVKRDNDQTGRPARVVVCAPSSIEAENLLRGRLHGHGWRFTGTKRCELQPSSAQHYAYTSKGKR